MTHQAIEQGAVLRTQVQELLERLSHVEEVLKNDQIDDRLRARVGVRFERLIKQRRTEVRTLLEELEGGTELGDAWKSLRVARSGCAPLFSECLAFVEGALTRAIDLDRGLCQTADTLLEELARLSERPWQRFTILAEGEYVVDLAEIIRIRFPDVDFWSLPVAAHEFGHYVGGTLEDDSDLTLAAPFKTAKSTGQRDWVYLHEQFADFFATYAVGPAYTCMCVLQRFDPSTAQDAGDLHPSANARVRLSLDVLERMDRDSGFLTPFTEVRSVLADTWQEMVSSATGGSAALGAESETALTDVGDQLWGILEDAMPKVRYSGWLASRQTAQNLLEQHGNRAPLSAAADNLRDVLNAAWAARLMGPAEVSQPLAEWSGAACRSHVAANEREGETR